jgi:putative endonuclease
MFARNTASPSQLKGLHYEKLALKFLKKQGLKFLHKNYHCRLGEIDLVMHEYGNGLETVNKSNQQKLHRYI